MVKYGLNFGLALAGAKVSPFQHAHPKGAYVSKKNTCRKEVQQSPRTRNWTHCVLEKDHKGQCLDRHGNWKKPEQLTGGT
jgi:hypothetical protein